jgi:hypothetical protein
LPESSVALLHQWHDFYILMATVSATIIGAMFVVASVASSYLTPENATRSRNFLSPIVIHLSTIVLGCAATLVPSLAAVPFAILFGIGGLAGLAYSVFIACLVSRNELILEDRLWYAIVPILGYLIMIAAAILILRQEPWGLEILAIAFVILLLAGIRNAWDLTLFFVTRENRPSEPGDRGSA